MASPTNAEIETQISEAIELIDDIDETTFLSNLDTLQQAMEGDFSSEVLQGAENARNSMASLLLSMDGLISPLLITYGKLAGSPQLTPAELLDPINGDLFQYFIDNSRSVNSREITHATASAGGGNVGNGTIRRLVTDRDTSEIEAVSITQKKFLCIQDENTGARVGEEIFSVGHETTDKDDVDWTNHGDTGTITTRGPENGIGSNMSFQDLDGTADTASGLNTIPDWDIDTGAITDFEYDTAVPSPFQSSPTEKDGTAFSLKMKATTKISQKIRDIGQTLNPNVPHFFLIYWNREDGTGTGTLQIDMGSQNASVVLAAQTGWNALFMVLDENLWYDLFLETDLDITISWTKTGGTFINIDYMVFAEMEQFDGTWFIPVSGATLFANKDVFTFNDTLSGTEGKVQMWIYRLYRSYLPAVTGGGETLPDP